MVGASDVWTAFDVLPIGACVRSADGEILYANDALGVLLGYDLAHLLGSPLCLVECEARDPGCGSVGRPCAYRRNGGRLIRVIETETPIVSDDGTRVFLRTLTDVTCLSDPILADGERLRTILARSPIGVSVSRREDGVIIFANARFAELLGLPLERVIGSRAAGFYADEDQRQRVVTRLKSDGAVLNHEVQFRRADGSPFWTLFTVNTAEIDGVAVNLAWIYDYTERRRMEETLREMASRDPLTGIFNRRSFMELAQQQLSRASRFVEPLSIMVLDIDHFKQVNDTYGHAAGDEALRGISRVCQEALREYDVFGRLGGEEFVFALPDTAVEDGLGVAERIRRGISRTAFVTCDPRFELTVSIGIAAVEGFNDDIERAIHRADIALYRSKRLGRNRSSIFRPEML